jgi:hypothetical protein
VQVPARRSRVSLGGGGPYWHCQGLDRETHESKGEILGAASSETVLEIFICE